MHVICIGRYYFDLAYTPSCFATALLDVTIDKEALCAQ